MESVGTPVLEGALGRKTTEGNLGQVKEGLLSGGHEVGGTSKCKFCLMMEI